MQPLVPLVFHDLPSLYPLHLEEMIIYTCIGEICVLAFLNRTCASTSIHSTKASVKYSPELTIKLT